MLDVHPAHHAANTWREFFIHIATIVLGLLIAVGLEQTVEAIHHRRQVAETREALHKELEQNQKTMASFVAEFHKRTTVVQGNLAVFHYLELHPGAPQDKLPATVNWHSVGSSFSESVWTTAQQGSILGLMPPEEVRDQSRLYSMLQTCSDSFAVYRVASNEARVYTVDAASVSNLSPAQIQEQIRLTRIVLNRLYRFGADLRNLAVRYPQFAPGPSIEELSSIVHESPDERREIESQSTLAPPSSSPFATTNHQPNRDSSYEWMRKRGQVMDKGRVWSNGYLILRFLSNGPPHFGIAARARTM
jgi:hypothetical protein